MLLLSPTPWKLHALAGTSRKKQTVVVNGEVGCASFKKIAIQISSASTSVDFPSDRHRPACSSAPRLFLFANWPITVTPSDGVTYMQ